MADLTLILLSSCITPPLLLLLLLLLLLPTLRFHFYRGGAPQGTLGLPLVGETLRLISAYRSDNPEPFVDERIKKYGMVFTTHLFGEPTVFSADAEVNRFVLQNEGKLFEGSYPSSVATLLGEHSLVLMKGSLHKRMHSLTMSFANSAIIRHYFFSHIDRLLRLNLSSWPSSILLMEESKKITFEISMKQLMSLDPCEWMENVRKEYVMVIEGFFTVPFFSFTYRRALKARGKVVAALSQVVADRRKESNGGVKKEDMLEAMFSSEEKLSDEQIVGFLVALLVAGYETTSTIMTLAVKFLTETPMALAVLREEHDEVRRRRVEQQKNEDGDEVPLTWSDYKSMEFTQCVINETLRMANIIGGIFRRATTDVNVKGYLIPKGWKVFASFRAVHLDDDSFDDARTFNPWRWQKQSSGGGAIKQNSTVFMPFGGGPRICPGYELARVVLSVFLHHIVTRFTWEAAEEDELVHFPTTRTRKRYPILLKRRLNYSEFPL